MTSSTRSLSFGLALLAGVVVGACAPGGQTPTPAGGGRGTQDSAIPVTVARVEERTVQLDIRVIGSVEPSQTVAVRAQTTGELVAVNFKEGDDVQKGQVIFELDRRPLEAALDQAQANLDRDIATALNAKSSAARYQDLLQRGIATREQADQSRTAATALDATVEADRAAVANARVQLQYATIRAPFSGRTGSLMVHLGNLVRGNDLTPLVVLNQVAPVNVVFSVPENRLLELKRYLSKGTLTVEAAPPDDDGPPSSGTITFVDNAVDPTTGSIKVKGSFPNANRRLWPGQFVNVIVTLTTVPNAVVVPAAAVLTGQRGPYAVVVKADKTVEFRNVKVARVIDDATVVSDGLKGGETVVTDGHIRLVPSSRVSIKASPAPQASKDAP